jgi:hypothetical protein
MPDIDAEAAGILIENGCDPLTAVAGSIIEEPRPQRPLTTRSKGLIVAGIISGLVAAMLLRWLAY